MTTRLNSGALAGLPAQAYVADYDRSCDIGIVHIGMGAFHRAHQAFYTDLAVEAAGDAKHWGIVGVSLRSAGVRDTMAPQDCLYSVTEKSSEGQQSRVVKIVQDVLVAPENPAAVVDLLSRESVKICSLTITEKGYCLAPGSGELDFNHPDIQHDLAAIGSPKTMIGFVVRACEARRAQGKKGFTLMSCDNLSHNGEVAKKSILAFAQHADALLAEWIEQNISFVSTMVDRIVPATTADDLASVESVLGVQDQAAVVCEPFRQWVIEDVFPYGRPAWDQVGAHLVEDVTPFEIVKLRTLNGVHSALAYLGYLCGFPFIHQAIADPVLLAFVKHLMDAEIHPTLHVPAGIDIEAYKQKIRDRFANTAIQYKTSQVAMDGSQKLPQRLLKTAFENLEQRRACDAIALVVAAWIRYLGGQDERGETIPLSDPMADILREAYDNGCSSDANSAPKVVNQVMNASGLFAGGLDQYPLFRERVIVWFDMIQTHGTLKTVEMFDVELGSAP